MVDSAQESEGTKATSTIPPSSRSPSSGPKEKEEEEEEEEEYDCVEGEAKREVEGLEYEAESSAATSQGDPEKSDDRQGDDDADLRPAVLLACPDGDDSILLDSPTAIQDEMDAVEKRLMSRAGPVMMSPPPPCWVGCTTATAAASAVFSYDRDAFVLSARVATSMALASLFALLFPPDRPFPYAQWVLTSAAVVSWQTHPDTASAVKKALERTIGTALGALLGVAVGFLSLASQRSQLNPQVQASVLGVSIALVSFALPYVSIRLGLGGSYAARLGVVSFGIVAVSFFVPEQQQQEFGSGSGPVWEAGVFRAFNIMIGCVVALFSLLLWPQSTKSLIVDKVQAQMRTAGDSAAKVLDLAYHSFVNKRTPAHWDLFVPLESGFVADSAYTAYMKGVGDWKSCNDLFPMLKYDPFFLLNSSSRKERVHFRDHMALRCERAFRIQTNLILLDSIVRNGVNLDEYSDSFEVLRDVGRRVQVMLDLKIDMAERKEAVRGMIETDLVRVRLFVRRLRDELSRQQQPGDCDVSYKRVRSSLSSYTGSGTSVLQDLESREQVALFFQLVEHLIIRSSLLFYFCQEL